MTTTLSFAQILQRTMETDSHVRIYRRLAPTVPICGYVAAVNDDLLAVYVVEANVRFDGVVVIRTQDVGEVRTRGDDENFTKRALASRGLELPDITVDVTSWWSVVASMRLTHQIANFQSILDLDQPDSVRTYCTHGTVVELQEDEIQIRPIDIGAVWKRWTTSIRFDSLLRVDFGGLFERMLGELARDPDSDSSGREPNPID